MFANRHDIRKIETDSRLLKPVIEKLKSSVSVDYDFQSKMLYWSDVTLKALYRATIFPNGSTGRPEAIMKDSIDTPDGIAVDWIYGNIYWTDTGNDRVEVSRQDGSFRKTIIDTDLDEPRAIAVDPNEG